LWKKERWKEKITFNFNNMDKILKFLSGKKSVIASIIMTVIAYLATKGLLGDAEVTLIGALTTIIFGTASYATGKMYKSMNK